VERCDDGREGFGDDWGGGISGAPRLMAGERERGGEAKYRAENDESKETMGGKRFSKCTTNTSNNGQSGVA